MAAAMMASAGFQGSGVILPVAAEILLNMRFQVEGINCAGPMAPPYPKVAETGHETLVLSGSRPRLLIIDCTSGRSRAGWMPFENIVPELTLLVWPLLRLIMTQEPTLAPRLDSC